MVNYMLSKIVAIIDKQSVRLYNSNNRDFNKATDTLLCASYILQPNDTVKVYLYNYNNWAEIWISRGVKQTLIAHLTVDSAYVQTHNTYNRITSDKVIKRE